MAQKSFAASVGAWARQTEARTLAVHRHAVQTLAEEVRKVIPEGGHMPVDTGFLRASLMASTAAMPRLEAPGEAKTYSEASGQSDIVLVLAGATLYQKIYLGFTAVYARRLEYGFEGEDVLGRTYHQQGYGFVRLTAQRWKKIVAESVRVILSRVQSR